ncbi:MAG: ferritin family protein [Candidatus Thiodiazotropha sp. (ex Dulcina madagascariensis)]|nr:ferritin family protein [Candidatus Thiodiazotropha sp. (ex Epidulcina cf. delphinae)]MCU7921079.1 ferritin family protein [Candidatus Thiodiazotropha sp. (ex Dulcina madagascariensis)]MCU7926614.1 ferritin family protein [Candidatus Thiodiazotropha sp. (ex Dulcina madagascariensis)]MCU7934797.1 ferritin family protein [Candidatus Thiodiazotropha sp. (ex Dulcina madagascariensis)]
MSDQAVVTIDTVGEFLVHALELEEASSDHYEELADSMEIHNNLQVAELFRKLAGYSRQHAKEVQDRTEGMDLPKLTPWDFKWKCPSSPESFCMEEASYMMTTTQAMKIALFNEIRGRDFYLQVAENTANEEVKKIASEMAEEEGWHVEMLREWQTSLAEEKPLEDLDPPNMPE